MLLCCSLKRISLYQKQKPWLAASIHKMWHSRCLAAQSQLAVKFSCRARSSGGINTRSYIRVCSDQKWITDRRRAQRFLSTFKIKKWIYVQTPDWSWRRNRAVLNECTECYTVSEVSEVREPESQVSAEFSDWPECKHTDAHTLHVSLLTSLRWKSSKVMETLRIM